MQADEEYEGNVYYKQRHDVASQDVAERRGDGLGEYVKADVEYEGRGHYKHDVGSQDVAGAGEYVQAGEEYEGRVYDKQRDNLASGGYNIYKVGERWIVSPSLGGANVGLRSQETGDLLPPTQNWEYVDADGKWRDDDASLTLTFASLPTPCPMVRVAGEGEVVEKQGSSLGDYRFTLFKCNSWIIKCIQVSSSSRH